MPADPAPYAHIPTDQLERELRRPDLAPQDRQLVEAELKRRLARDLLGDGAPHQPPAQPAPPPRPAPGQPPPPPAPPPRRPPPQVPYVAPQRYVHPPAVAPRPRRRWGGCLAAVVVAVLAVGGAVGGLIYLAQNQGGEDLSFDNDRSVSSSWVATANAYCRRMDLELKSAGSLSGDTRALSGLARVMRAMNGQLRAMPVPADARDAVRSMTEDWDEVADHYDEMVAAAQAGDSAGFEAASAAAESANQRGNQTATSLGLSDCAGAGGL